LDLASFRNRLAKDHRHWSRWARRAGIECYRVYDRDVPQFPLAIDRYGDHAHLQEFDTGWQMPAAEHADWVEGVRSVVAEVLALDAPAVHYKRRERQRGPTQYGRLAPHGGELIVREGGLRFAVDLDSYVDTGLFLDHRKTRAWIREHAAGRRMLNLFGYTGSFTVYAASGGAAATTTVDLSNTYLNWADRNLALNALSRPEHALVRADVLEWLAEAARARRLFDLIVLDPPSFSNSARMRETLDVQRDHVRLVDGAMALLAVGGELVFSTNRRGFRLDPLLTTAYHCESIAHWTVPEDFRRHPPHACWRITANQRIP
jgi:23S rRNA (cytosine1962-C5)-methyltransferase